MIVDSTSHLLTDMNWQNDRSGLTQEQQYEIREAFKLFDRDNDGVIPVSEYNLILRCLGLDLTEEELLDFIKEFDPQGKGILTCDDVLNTVVKCTKEPDMDEELREAFRILDRDGNGVITAAELRHVMTNLCDKLTDEEVDEMIKEADLDGDGMINYEEDPLDQIEYNSQDEIQMMSSQMFR